MKPGLIHKLFQKKTEYPVFGILGHLSFFILLLGSVYFYKERILFADSAFQFFKIVNFEKINVEAFRYGAILPEIPLLLAMKLGVGLKMLLIIYSASFIALYYIVFLLCLKVFKNVPAALSVVLILVMCISQSFFHAVTETHQSLVFSVLLFAILQYSSFRYSLVRFLLAFSVILISFFAHPVALYSLVFVIGYSAIDKNQLKSAKPYILLSLIVGIAVVKVMLTDQNSYEGKFFSELLKSPAVIFDLPQAYSTKFLLNRVFGLYFWVIILEFMLIILLAMKKEYLKLSWQLGISGFFLIITLLTYNQGDSEMMMERAFMPLALLVSVPFLKEMLENLNQFRYVKLIFLTIIIIFSLNRIYTQGKAFRERIRFNQELLAKTAKLPNRKFIIQSIELQKHHYTYWSHSFETLMLSSITANMPVQTIFPANDPENLKKYTEENVRDVFLGADFWLEWGIDNLNHKYFNLSKELPYAVVKIDEL
ncbi:MAG TPA: hypothetical protein VLQ91_17315 [Draconibacterium sp.]|nr:hypothetical protein [Draconibacterium sp.]